MKEFLRKSVAFWVLIWLFCAWGILEDYARGEESLAVMSLDLGLTGQAGWTEWYNRTDSPEGAYLGTIAQSQSSVTGVVPLGKELQPGEYIISLKVYDYKVGGKIDVVIGGQQIRFEDLNPTDRNAWWTLPIAFNLTAPASSVRLTILRTKPVGEVQLYLLKGLYVSSYFGDSVDSLDRIVNWTYPTEMDTTAPVKGNVIANSSFEVGMGHGWGAGEAAPRDFTIRSLWDDTVAFHGLASAKLPAHSQLVSRLYRLKSNKKYTVSAWLRSTHKSTATLTIENVTDAQPGYPPSVVRSVDVAVDGTWRRVSISEFMLQYPTADYQIRILSGGPDDGYTWIDALQLEEGDLTSYSASVGVEVGLVSDAPNNLFFYGQPALARLLVANHGGSPASGSVSYRVYDYWNREVRKGSLQFTMPAASLSEQELDLTTGLRGIFRIVFWVDGVDQAAEEVVYCIVNPPQRVGIDISSVMGTHSDFYDHQLAALGRLGFKWNRTSSPSQALRWAAVEPVEGQYVWFDEEIDKAAAHGVVILGTIGQEAPEWAKSNGLPRLDKWETFVGNVARHYRGKVAAWEIWNEPQYEFTPGFYGELLIAASRAIRREDPDSKIVGFGGCANLTWNREVLTYLGVDWRNYMDLGSTHVYPRSPASKYPANPGATGWNGVEMWNTEAGLWEFGFYKGLNSNFVQAMDYIWAHVDSVRYQHGQRGAAELTAYSFLHTIGLGLTKYFYYDARTFIGPAYYKTHPSIFEYDDSIRAKGAGLAILARLLDHSIGLGNLSTQSHTCIYLFNRGGTPVAGVWATDEANRTLNLSVQSGYAVYDMMGNRVSITGGRVPYNASPVYIEGQGISVDALKATLQLATFSIVPDTRAPSLSLEVFPIGSTSRNPVKFRWLGVDETSLPWDGAPEAILYSYKLEGRDASWSAWSARSFVDYLDVPDGSYVFLLKAKDAAGNESGILRHAFVVDADQSPPQPTACSLDMDGDFDIDSQDLVIFVAMGHILTEAGLEEFAKNYGRANCVGF